MARARAAAVVVVFGVAAGVLLSGGSGADPRTPAGLPGLPPPFLGTAVVGSGALTAAIDAYGDVADLRVPGPAGRALIENPAERQSAGTVAAMTGIVPRVRIGGAWLPLWRADWVSQRYRPGTNVLVTEARFGRTRVVISYAAGDERLACLTRSSDPAVRLTAHDPSAGTRLRCQDAAAGRLVRVAGAHDRRWLARARPLGSGAPAWARGLYERSLLVLRALTDRRSGAVAAGPRDGWAYVWPRDAGTAALAFAAAGYRPEARRVARFLLGLDLGAAARFYGDGAAVAGRQTQGDAAGWVTAAARAGGLPLPTRSLPWRDRADYQEGEPGTYLANAIAALTASPGPQAPSSDSGPSRRQRESRLKSEFVTGLGVMREPDARGGLDSAAAWAVRPFALPLLYPPARRTLLHLAGIGASGPAASRFGITPSERWPGADPWTAPTAWSAWGLAALADREGAHAAAAYRDRRAALRLLADLRRAATPAGTLPERVDARTGVPRSTTPLAWSHAIAILALQELWPGPRRPG